MTPRGVYDLRTLIEKIVLIIPAALIILIALIILMKRREVGVWILLLGRLQEAPPTKVGHDDDQTTY